MTDHEDDAQGQTERRDAGREPLPERVAGDRREVAERRRFPPGEPKDGADPGAGGVRSAAPGHAAARRHMGAATRLAEEMRREAENRARQAVRAPSEPDPPAAPLDDPDDDLARSAAATRAFLERVEEATGELAGLLERVRVSAEELAAELGAAADGGRAGDSPTRPERAANPSAAPVAPDGGTTPPGNGHQGGGQYLAPPEPVAPGVPGTPTEEKDEEQRARFLALNMALNGASRQETARYLTENVPLVDKTVLLNEIYRLGTPGAAHSPSEVIKDL